MIIYDLKTTSKFKKNYQKAQRRGLKREDMEYVLDKLIHGEKLDKKYKDHILKGKYKGFHECHIKPDWLLIYLIENDILTITLINTGSHADLFKK